MRLLQGDCLAVLKQLDSNSIDGCVTDPPAGIGFMNKDWDSDKGGRDGWIKWMTEVFTEVRRVLKPGAHCLVWSIPRTSHWTGQALEDAGFEIRDCVHHLYGQGFPKSMNVSKQIDKKFGKKREVVGEKTYVGTGKVKPPHYYEYKDNINEGWERPCREDPEWRELANKITAPASDEAKYYDGYGTQLKPAVEVWWLIRKPISEKTIVNNVLKHGTGALNIDKSRIPTSDKWKGKSGINNPNGDNLYGVNEQVESEIHSNGRFPSNVIHDGSRPIMKEFEKYGHSKSKKTGYNWDDSNNDNSVSITHNIKSGVHFDDEGSVARFFYCAKPSTQERNTGCEDLEEVEGNTIGEGLSGSKDPNYLLPLKKNNHPTVKSVKLMSYLINLIMPPTGIVLDPFMGSGSTGVAALLNNYDFVGIEMEAEYMEIARKRISSYEEFRRYI